MSTGSDRLIGVEATHALAARVADDLRPGMVIGLVGDLGAGKTEFTRGLVQALDVPRDQTVCSPSYLLLNVYEGGRLPVAHFDAYFMDGPDDLERAGLDDLRRSGHVIVVEWADRVLEVLPRDTLWFQLEAGDQPDERRVHTDAPAESER
jgi:tRNA threonylcarbamoyladenosine biosynthesis protein TsaE